MAARFSDELGHRILAVPVTADQLLVAFSLLDRVQVFALNILDQRNFGRHRFVEVADDRRDLVQLRLLRGPPTPFAGDNLEAIVNGAHQNRLQYAALDDRCGQLRNSSIVEILPWLQWVRPNSPDLDRPYARLRRRSFRFRRPNRLVDQRAKAPAQPGRLLHAASSATRGSRAIISRASRT